MSIIEKVNIPEGTSGKWSIKRFTVSEQDAKFSALRAAIKGRGYVQAGTYTMLRHENRGCIMSDTQDEMRDHLYAVHKANGHVLINGLGLGMVLSAVLKKDEVNWVTVVEIDADVIKLVAPSFSGQRITIVNASAYDYKPEKGTRYGAEWHDIWDSICGDNLPQMTKLKRKYGRLTDWQGCWGEYECRRYSGR